MPALCILFQLYLFSIIFSLAAEYSFSKYIYNIQFLTIKYSY